MIAIAFLSDVAIKCSASCYVFIVLRLINGIMGGNLSRYRWIVQTETINDFYFSNYANSKTRSFHARSCCGYSTCLIGKFNFVSVHNESLLVPNNKLFSPDERREERRKVTISHSRCVSYVCCVYN